MSPLVLVLLVVAAGALSVAVLDRSGRWRPHALAVLAIWGVGLVAFFALLFTDPTYRAVELAAFERAAEWGPEARVDVGDTLRLEGIVARSQPVGDLGLAWAHEQTRSRLPSGLVHEDARYAVPPSLEVATAAGSVLLVPDADPDAQPFTPSRPVSDAAFAAARARPGLSCGSAFRGPDRAVRGCGYAPGDSLSVAAGVVEAVAPLRVRVAADDLEPVSLQARQAALRARAGAASGPRTGLLDWANTGGLTLAAIGLYLFGASVLKRRLANAGEPAREASAAAPSTTGPASGLLLGAAGLFVLGLVLPLFLAADGRQADEARATLERLRHQGARVEARPLLSPENRPAPGDSVRFEGRVPEAGNELQSGVAIAHLYVATPNSRYERFPLTLTDTLVVETPLGPARVRVGYPGRQGGYPSPGGLTRGSRGMDATWAQRIQEAHDRRYLGARVHGYAPGDTVASEGARVVSLDPLVLDAGGAFPLLVQTLAAADADGRSALQRAEERAGGRGGVPFDPVWVRWIAWALAGLLVLASLARRLGARLQGRG